MAQFTRSHGDIPLRTDDGGHGNDLPLDPGFGGGGDDPDDKRGQDYDGRLRRARMLVVALFIAIGMFFVVLATTMLIRRFDPSHYDRRTHEFVTDWKAPRLPAILWLNTFVLFLSSLTLEVARRRLIRTAKLAPVYAVPGIAREVRSSTPLLVLTVLLGLGFLAGQYAAWNDLHARGVFVATNVGSTFFFVLTASHAVHLMAGLLALAYALGLSLWKVPLEREVIVVDGASWYWHYMAVLWVGIFALLTFVR